MGILHLLLSVAFVGFVQATEFLDDDYGTVIGIDLGGSNARVAVMQNGHVEVLINEAGSRSTPCYVAFTDDGRLFGDAAKGQAVTDPSRTIFDFKQMMGVDFDHPDVLSRVNELPYVMVNQKGRAHVEVKLDNSLKSFSLEDVASTILADLKQTAESYLGKKVTHAVIAVPSYFSDTQRQAVKNAGDIAGLTVLRIVNEPTAATLAYSTDLGLNNEFNVLVFDLGGRALNVAVSNVDYGVYEILATARNADVGGEQINKRIRDNLVDRYNSEHIDTPLMAGEIMSRLETEVEQAKRTLSSNSSALIEVKGLDNGRDFSEILTREEFEKLSLDLLERSLDLVGKVLDEAHLKKEDIDTIILAGGSSHIPKIRNLIEAYFGGKKVLEGINPDELVCIGAAIQGEILLAPIDNYSLLMEVTPLSFGIGTTGGLMRKIIPRNMVLPAQKRQIFSTSADNQSAVMIDIFKGEHVQTSKNYHLGTLNLTSIPPAPRGVPEIELIFSLDVDGQLNVTASDLGSGKSMSLLNLNHESPLDHYEIDRHLTEAEEHYVEDMAILDAVEEALGLKNLTHYVIDAPPEHARIAGPPHDEL